MWAEVALRAGAGALRTPGRRPPRSGTPRHQRRKEPAKHLAKPLRPPVTHTGGGCSRDWRRGWSAGIGSSRDIGHVEVEIGESVVMLFDAKPGWPATPAHLRVYVDDTGTSVERAVEAGARVVTRPTLLAFGERVARVRDAQGHLWWLHEQVEDVPPEELGERFADPAAQEAMAYVQRTLREEMETAATGPGVTGSP
ncbi:VOC family protein [Streptomyces sp. NPDC007063]|uniref:VOC family protein n=1 Tax=Streptomyces sp. NPDC007063 TaxID=3364772 RepID=UPI003683F28C